VTSRRFQELAATLRGEFLALAGERAAAMRALLARLDHAPEDQQALAELQLAFHNFAGSGSTYGFPRLSQLGGEGERWCQERRAEGRSLGEGQRREVRALFESVLDALRDEGPAKT
jgi:chemotaxis protein histidine kinase CheA